MVPPDRYCWKGNEHHNWFRIWLASTPTNAYFANLNMTFPNWCTKSTSRTFTCKPLLLSCVTHLPSSANHVPSRPQALWPEESRRDSGKLEFFSLHDFCGKTMQAVREHPIKNFKFFQFPLSLSWQPTTGQRAWELGIWDCSSAAWAKHLFCCSLSEIVVHH